MVKKHDLKMFAIIWSAIFGIIGILPLLKGQDIKILAIIIALIFNIIAFTKPQILTRFYKIWMKFGEFIGGIMSKIMMTILYFGIFTPVSIFLKIIGKDLLDKKIDKSRTSYWIERETQPQSMKNQF
jgi:formate-dependent nitrite reductase membrane component NrfD